MAALACSELRWRVCSSCVLWQIKSMAGVLEENGEKKAQLPALAEEIHGGRTGRERREERGIDGRRTSGGDYEDRKIRQ
jgi:hypothetical protein